MAFAFIAGGAVTAQPATAQEPRFALLIGNKAYNRPLTPLNRPHKDVARLAKALTGAGFEVDSRRDLSRRTTLRRVQAFRDRLNKAGRNAVGFFYYSGHGGSAASVGSRRRNYIIPAKSNITRADDLVSDGVALDDIIGMFEKSRAKAVFVVFDACRNELPWSKGGADPDKAFAAVRARPGMLIAFSTDVGATAPDDGAFADALARHIEARDVPHSMVFDAAAREVGQRRGINRLPHYLNQIRQLFYFRRSMRVAAPRDEAAARNPSERQNAPSTSISRTASQEGF